MSKPQEFFKGGWRAHLPDHLSHKVANAIGAAVALSTVVTGSPASASQFQASGPMAPAFAQAASQNKLPVTVFNGQVGDPVSRRLAQATVYLAETSPSGQVLHFFSGVVVANSASGGSHNKILTAGHAAKDMAQAPLGATVTVFSSSGARLGNAAVDTIAQPSGRYLGNDDIASLRIVNPTSNYDRIAGEPLSPTQSMTMITGLISNPKQGAPTFGMSGAPVADATGLKGIFTIADLDGPYLKPADFLPGAFPKKQPAQMVEQGAMPSTIRYFATSIGPSNVLGSLGPAALGVTKVGPMATTRLVAMGFPAEHARTYHATGVSLNTANPNDFNFQLSAGAPSPSSAAIQRWQDPKIATGALLNVFRQAKSQLPLDQATTQTIIQASARLQKNGIAGLLQDVTDAGRYSDVLTNIVHMARTPALKAAALDAQHNFRWASDEAQGLLPPTSVAAAPAVVPQGPKAKGPSSHS